jgi:hypothetical protein
VDENSPLCENFIVEQDQTKAIEKRNHMILDAFSLVDNAFVDDTLSVQIPQLTGAKDIQAFRAVNNQELCNYANPFLEALSTIFSFSGKFVSVSIYPTVSKYYSAIEVVDQILSRNRGNN